MTEISDPESLPETFGTKTAARIPAQVLRDLNIGSRIVVGTVGPRIVQSTLARVLGGCSMKPRMPNPRMKKPLLQPQRSTRLQNMKPSLFELETPNHKAELTHQPTNSCVKPVANKVITPKFPHDLRIFSPQTVSRDSGIHSKPGAAKKKKNKKKSALE